MTEVKQNHSNTIYDDIFRTLLEKCTTLIPPLINLIFHTDYDMNVPVRLLSNEHYFVSEDGEEEKRVTDSCILIENHLYHIECESNANMQIFIRMIEYDFHIALSNAEIFGNICELTFPKSAVLFLRQNANTPDSFTERVIFSNGQKVEYQIPVIKLQEFSKEEIFEKNLFFFLPYYILRFEKRLKEINNNEDELSELVAEYKDIYERLLVLESNSVINYTYLWNLTNLTNRLIDMVAKDAKNIQREVITMGGQVLDLESEKIALEALEKGIREGHEKGIREGHEKGRIQTLYQLLVEGLISEEIFREKSGIDVSTAKKMCDN